MGRYEGCVVVMVLFGVVGCGGSCPHAGEPETAAAASPSRPAEHEATPELAANEAHETTPESGEQTKSPEPSSPEKDSDTKAAVIPEPQFPEHASVSDAVAAIPRGTERANIEPDLLGEPLKDQALFEPCKVGAQHFKLKVAIWNGHAVGVDVVTPNKKLAECVDARVRALEWRSKVRSLNTVEFSL